MLAVEHRIDFTARHEMPCLPEWHPWARGDAHAYALVVELHDVPDADIDDITMVLREAVAVLERAVEEVWPPDLGGEVAVRAGERDSVVEFAGDAAIDHGRWRHPVRVVRICPDLAPTDLPTTEQPPLSSDLAQAIWFVSGRWPAADQPLSLPARPAGLKTRTTETGMMCSRRVTEEGKLCLVGY